MTDTNYRNGDCTVTKCTITSLDQTRTLNVTGQVTFVNIYESATQPVIIGDVSFADAIGLYNNFPLTGEETFSIEFTTPNLNKISYDLKLWRYTDIELNDSSKALTYTGHLISKEGFINETKLVTKRFNKQISDSVSDIVTDYLLSKDTVTIDQTVGIDNHLMSNLTPLQMIDNLRYRAVSSEYKSSSFVFYQDHKGIHFTTLEKMLKTVQNPVATYRYDDSLDHDVTTDGRFTDIISVAPVQGSNTLEKLQYGGTANIIKRFDIITGQTTDVAYSDAGDIFTKTGQTSREQTTQFNQQYGQSTSNKVLVSFGQDTSPQLNEKIGLLRGFVNRINQNILNIAIFGNSSLAIGDPLTCVINSSTGLTGTDNKKQTNNYMISKIRHMIDMSHRPVYSQSLELLSNSYAT